MDIVLELLVVNENRPTRVESLKMAHSHLSASAITSPFAPGLLNWLADISVIKTGLPFVVIVTDRFVTSTYDVENVLNKPELAEIATH